jgi:hypothetical protein
MSNRKSRRAASNKITTADEIPLAQPNRTKSTGHKTLLDIAAEKQSELFKDLPNPINAKESNTKIVTTKINPDGTLSHSDSSPAGNIPETASDADADPIGPLGQAVLYTITLTMVHFTFDVFVHHQYRTEIDWNLISQKTATAFPILFCLVYTLHPRSNMLWAQMLYLVGSVLAGCYIVKSSSEEPYYAVMKRAPPLGTIWIWCVLELRLEFALVGLAGVGGFFWYGGYTIF